MVAAGVGGAAGETAGSVNDQPAGLLLHAAAQSGQQLRCGAEPVRFLQPEPPGIENMGIAHRSGGGPETRALADVLLTHAPGTPGAGTDDAHRALPAVDALVEQLRPALHLHGHVHLHGADRRVFSLPSGDDAAGESTAHTASHTAAHGTRHSTLHRTLVVNTVGWTLTRVHPPHGTPHSTPRTTPRAELLLKGR